MKNLVTLFKALSDETRLSILIILSKRHICAKGLSKHLGISPPAVSQHIKILKDAGLITGEKDGYFVRYHLNPCCFEELGAFINLMESPDASTFKALIEVDCKNACQKKSKKCCHQDTERSS